MFLTKGVTYQLEDLLEEVRKEDLGHMIERGNHKSADDPDNHPTLLKNYEKEVRMGWMLPVTIESVKKIKDAAVIPVGIAKQFTIDNKGRRQVKRRTTHDATFPAPSNHSLNDRLIMENLEKCFYGHCLLRLLHTIQKMRIKHPELRILITKLDLDAAYRRLHMLARMAVMTITIIKKIAYILMHLPFGVANGPHDFCLISEPLIDLVNDILRDATFDPSRTYSPIKHILQPPKDRYEDKTPFGKARDLFVTVPFHYAAADGYIDDLITVMIEKDDWVEKGSNAAPLAVHTVFRPKDISDPLPRDDPASIRKLDGEGTPDERKVILGWLVDTRLFKIFLPGEKASEWIREINRIVKQETIETKQLESTIGRLNHAGYVIPQARYFLNRMRHLLANCKKYGRQKIPHAVKDDLKLWTQFIDKTTRQGIDINNVTFTRQTDTVYSDACEHGIGGYTTQGKAWRYQLPDEMIGHLSINLLEFIAAAITIVLTIRDSNKPHKILALTDNSSALGWLYKASFTTSMEAHNKTARWLAGQLLKKDAALYSQHIPGRHNALADMLSRDHHISDEQLTYIFHSIYPEQTPLNFRISPLPTEVTSWLHSLAPSMTKTTASQPKHCRSKLGALTDGSDSWKELESRMNGLKVFNSINEHNCCQRLQAAAVETNTAKQKDTDSLEKPLNPPSRMYVRSFGRIYGQTQV